MTENETNENVQGDFARAWQGFVKALRGILTGPPPERPLDAFISLRNEALDAAENDDVTLVLQEGWSKLHESTQAPLVAHLLLTEVQAFPVAIELTKGEQMEDVTPTFSKKRLLGLGKTVLGSVSDILNDVLDKNPLAKGVLTVLDEVLDIFSKDS